MMDNNIEILQVSSLEDYNWPDKDPHSIPQRTRPIMDSDIELVRRCVNNASIDKESFLKNVIRKENLSKTESIMKLLAHRKFQMNPAGEVFKEEKWRKCIDYAIEKNEPIDIVYPQFCVIPNAPKRYTNNGSAAGEDCTIELFKLISEHVKWFHEPGIRVHALADASLYASAFQTHQTEVDSYFASLKERINVLEAQDCVFLYDYSELLTTKCHPDYQKLYYEIGQKVWAGKIEELIPNTDIATLRRSVRCSVNTRRFQLSHHDHLVLFGPQEFRDINHPFYDIIETMTDIAFREVITIRLACSEIDLSSRLWPNAIRATCHKGQKNGRWAIGLRTYPEYYGSCKLLPYHGMPYITKNGKGKPKLEIAPEVLLRNREDLIRVTFDEDEVYVYLSEDVEHEINPGIRCEKHKGMRSDEFLKLDRYE